MMLGTTNIKKKQSLFVAESQNTHKYSVWNKYSLTIIKYGGAYSKFKGLISIELLAQKQ